ncbi:NADH dehydrogenase [ubiquinone] 1 beta subcomplex subunit 11, mitochondrial-like [Vespa mandarinia]|uniref:NADH dehydrogenase [ubiquinone] 1 beta subcomplex subunit 11, mitochondrial-like n=1 Tax=Vespa mandarinia TaxID=7446 RepID=UPI00161B275B|nr:NADH dehydrogenase [ubiquinone] 1 beta subcomplex subunit 11, mitochondrial-like [Vespa mandarinia]
MAGICRLSTSHTLKNGMNLLRLQKITCRAITTSPKKDDSTNVIELPEKKKRWVKYGFDDTSEIDDRRKMHELFFVGITIGMILTGYVLMYKPDTLSFGTWAQREAYLQLRYREEHGLPPIDMNLIDPAKVVLPTDEELGNTEIII